MSMSERFLARPITVVSTNLVELKTSGGYMRDDIAFLVPKQWLMKHLERRGVDFMTFVTSYSLEESLHVYNEASELGIVVSERGDMEGCLEWRGNR